MEMNDKLKLYTTKEVAAIFKVSKTQVQHWEKQGELKPINWGETINGRPRKKRFIRYAHEEIIRHIESKKEVSEKK